MVNAQELENHLSTRSYIDGTAPSSADVEVFETVKLSQLEGFPHTARWFKHIASYAGETKALAAGKVPFAGFVAAGAAAGAAVAAAAEEEDDDEDVDLFGSDDDEVDEEAERLKAERVAEYTRQKEAKKAEKLAAGKTLAVAKSVVTLQVKPWDDETDIEAMEAATRAIEMDGLVWGASKFVPVGYGIKMLQITLVIEDLKVSLDELQERIQDECEDYVQSTDVAAMQKL